MQIAKLNDYILFQMFAFPKWGASYGNSIACFQRILLTGIHCSNDAAIHSSEMATAA
jgi:phenolic acid decarboxylase